MRLACLEGKEIQQVAGELGVSIPTVNTLCPPPWANANRVVGVIKTAVRLNLIARVEKGLSMANLFFSYTHKDEDLRNQLETHLAALKRQGLISAWHDRRIMAGHDFGKVIDANLDSADVILLLVSPDFIASDYCYEREMARAMERQTNGEARVIPVILRPCDWHDLPFRATPDHAPRREGYHPVAEY